MQRSILVAFLALILVVFVGLAMTFNEDYIQPTMSRFVTPTHLVSATPSPTPTPTPSPSPTPLPISDFDLNLYSPIPKDSGVYNPVQVHEVDRWLDSAKHKVLCADGKATFAIPENVTKIYVFTENSPSAYFVFMTGNDVNIKCQTSIPEKFQALYVYFQ